MLCETVKYRNFNLLYVHVLESILELMEITIYEKVKMRSDKDIRMAFPIRIHFGLAFHLFMGQESAVQGCE